MKQIKIIGIISSVLLILNYLEVGLIGLVFPNTEWMIKLNESFFRVIFVASMIAFYYLIAKILYSEFKINVKGIINALIIIQVLSTILKTAQYFSIMIPGFVFTLLYISVIIVFIMFGIKVLKLDSKIHLIIKTLKTFVISMFVAYGLIFISFILFTVLIVRMLNQEIDPAIFVNSIFMIYAIPYVFGLLFFFKIDKQPAVNT